MNIPKPTFERAAADAAERLTAGASRAGLVDVAVGAVDSPLGTLTVGVTPKGLVRLAYGEEDLVLEDLARRVSPRVLAAPRVVDPVRRQLDRYFAGRLHAFDVPIDWRLVTPGFTRKILRATARIPYGSLRTYAQMASRAGSPRASRAAGNALSSNPIPIVVPCHRVVHSGGGLGGYTGGLHRKEHLLSLEGVLEDG